MHSVGEDRKILGILGGLGPLSSAYFYELITKHTSAKCDQDHIDIILSSRATTPDRTNFICKKSDDDPLPYMLEDAKLLEQYGADAIIIPCNTAHYFLDEIRNAVDVPVPSILEETCKQIKNCGFSRPLLLATEGTIESGAYVRELSKINMTCEVPSKEDQSIINEIIYHDVKCGNVPDKSKLLSVSGKYLDTSCDCAILGCTELSTLKAQLKDDDRFVDSLLALAFCSIKMFGRKPVGFCKMFA